MSPLAIYPDHLDGQTEVAAERQCLNASLVLIGPGFPPSCHTTPYCQSLDRSAMSSSTPMAASPASQLIAMASNSPQSTLTPLQAATALGMSPSTPAAPSRLGTIAAASLNTPLTSAASPAVSIGGRSLTGMGSFLAPTPAHLAGQGWRGSRGSGSGSQSVVAGGTHAVRPRTVEEEADAFEGALKELASLGGALYDQM